ncbi:MAG: hypothetical protein FRX49_00911 [Trebouxia sp. A1-2]|nr:MAG: hypothetical protein FRX49_00911 [Trebouxia sp. A1-2]
MTYFAPRASPAASSNACSSFLELAWTSAAMLAAVAASPCREKHPESAPLMRHVALANQLETMTTLAHLRVMKPDQTRANALGVLDTVH